jgi:CRISPR-associated RAMP protein (TIGR02581 family)
MLKQLVNECLIELVIRPEGPVLVKSGIETVGGPDMAFVRTWRHGEPQVYLPGSSLKGMLRSHAERIARTFDETKACDPFSKSGPTMFCGHRFEARKKRFEENPNNAEVYAGSCPICRLFGSTWYGGRLATADAYAEGPLPRTEQRDGVGIDRFTGGASRGAKFELEVITSGDFVTSLHLRNFELWQLGLVGFLLQDLKDGLIRLGMGKSRGLGKVGGEVRSVHLDFLGPQMPAPANGQLTLKGAGEMVLEPVARAYDLACPDVLTVPFIGEWQGGPGRIRATARFVGDTFPWAEIGQRWVDYIQNYTTRPEMRLERFAGGE